MASPPPAAVEPAAPAAPAVATDPGAAIEIQNAPLTGAVELIEKRTNERLEIEILALPVATCTRVSVKLGGGARIGDVLDALEASIAGTGLEIVRGNGAHEIVRAGDAARHTGESCSINDRMLHQWVLAGVKRIDPTTVEIKRAHLQLWDEHFFSFYPSTDAPGPGKSGFVLTDSYNFETAAGVGAKPGDLVVAIQGVPLSYSTDVSTVSKKIRGADKVIIDIVRDGKPMKLTLRVVP